MAKLTPELELFGPVNCPQCATTPVTLLEEATRSELWWLECPACGHMWQVTKTDLLDAAAPPPPSSS